jgi:hypothetical protein
LAVPSTEEQQRLTYDINTSNALFVYMLEKYARIKEEGIPTRVFKMTTDWKRIFQATQGTQGCRSTTTPSKPLTFNGSFVFLQNFRNFVEYDKAPLIYQVIKETISHYRRTESKKSRKELEKQNKRKFEDFCCSQLAQESVQDREMIQCVLKLDGEDRATSVAEMCKHLNYLGRDHMVGLGFILSSNLNSSLMQILLIGKTTRKDSANEHSRSDTIVIFFFFFFFFFFFLSRNIIIFFFSKKQYGTKRFVSIACLHKCCICSRKTPEIFNTI